MKPSFHWILKHFKFKHIYSLKLTVFLLLFNIGKPYTKFLHSNKLIVYWCVYSQHRQYKNLKILASVKFVQKCVAILLNNSNTTWHFCYIPIVVFQICVILACLIHTQKKEQAYLCVSNWIYCNRFGIIPFYSSNVLILHIIFIQKLTGYFWENLHAS